MTFHTTISSFETSQINPDMMLSPSANLQPTSDLTVFPISVHTAPYRTSSDVQNTTLYMTISSSATLHTSPDLTISSASPQANTTLSSTAVQFTTPDLTISTHCGYAKSIEASYGSSVGAAFAGLIFGIIVTSAVCVVQHRMHWRAKKENITAVSQVMYEMDSVQNQPVSTRQNVQKTDIYNEISDENHKSRILQVMPIVRGIGQSSLDSNKCGVYNHLHEESPVNNDNGNYDHAHFSGNEQDADPNHYGKLDREEITGNYSVLQRERFDVVDNTENKSRENYFVLEKN
ncbi:uncharacterized protein LOC133195291 [Saccostrea echinata]|uniref:uncharacterized protein LOC133195291 n=1 Tax=Saccostrea echinata TaxID=191078 RepID=UPI002A7F10F6|nr:uncharacterized protein LOC133195291 [Saccostrea echinata]